MILTAKFVENFIASSMKLSCDQLAVYKIQIVQTTFFT